MPGLGRCELVDGRIVAMGPTSDEHGRVELTVGAILRDFVRPRRLGRVRVGEVGIYTRRDPTACVAQTSSTFRTSATPSAILLWRSSTSRPIWWSRSSPPAIPPWTWQRRSASTLPSASGWCGSSIPAPGGPWSTARPRSFANSAKASASGATTCCPAWRFPSPIFSRSASRRRAEDCSRPAPGWRADTGASGAGHRPGSVAVACAAPSLATAPVVSPRDRLGDEVADEPWPRIMHERGIEE
jgi:Putative restriction endonuclease